MWSRGYYKTFCIMKAQVKSTGSIHSYFRNPLSPGTRRQVHTSTNKYCSLESAFRSDCPTPPCSSRFNHPRPFLRIRHFRSPSVSPSRAPACPLSYSSSRSRWVEQGRRLPKLWTSSVAERRTTSRLHNAESTTDFTNEYSPDREFNDN